MLTCLEPLDPAGAQRKGAASALKVLPVEWRVFVIEGQQCQSHGTSAKTKVASERRDSPPNTRSEPGRDMGRGSRDIFGKETQQDLSAHYGAQFCKDLAQGTAE